MPSCSRTVEPTPSAPTSSSAFNVCTSAPWRMRACTPLPSWRKSSNSVLRINSPPSIRYRSINTVSTSDCGQLSTHGYGAFREVRSSSKRNPLSPYTDTALRRRDALRIGASTSSASKISSERACRPSAREYGDGAPRRSMMQQLIPWRRKPIPSASPVGPAPTISTCGVRFSVMAMVHSPYGTLLAPLPGTTMPTGVARFCLAAHRTRLCACGLQQPRQHVNAYPSPSWHIP